MCVLSIPFPAASSFSHKWLFGQAGCDWAAYISFFVGFSGVLILAMISVDRLIIIVATSVRMISKRVALLLIGACVAVSVVFATMPLLGWSSYTLEGANISCSVNWQGRSPGDTSYVITIFICCFLIPVGVIIYCYGRIYFHVRRTTSNLSFDTGIGPGTGMTVQMRKIFAMEKKMTLMIAIIVGTFLLSWSPYAIVSLWAAIGDPDSIPMVAVVIPAVIAKSGVIWNPFIYVVMNKNFRAALVRVLPFPCLKQTIEPTQRHDLRNRGKNSGNNDLNSKAVSPHRIQTTNDFIVNTPV
ncbi:unnamed protein product [Owenia fusiformis]|uniref:G-protein coupled receptors family 1 profile domain-containing protein n=1 Tax=Owenia fusiformis TaxID=6347 RepID=A0A8S4NB96_OWEFU|nr:unnamed protein product [Owenia fusiformis]